MLKYVIGSMLGASPSCKASTSVASNTGAKANVPMMVLLVPFGLVSIYCAVEGVFLLRYSTIEGKHLQLHKKCWLNQKVPKAPKANNGTMNRPGCKIESSPKPKRQRERTTPKTRRLHLCYAQVQICWKFHACEPFPMKLSRESAKTMKAMLVAL